MSLSVMSNGEGIDNFFGAGQVYTGNSRGTESRLVMSDSLEFSRTTIAL